MRFDILTLFPEIFSGYMTQSLLNKAIERKQVEIQLHDFRNWAKDKHHSVDDRPFGGGPGMVIKVDPVVECVEEIEPLDHRPSTIVMLSPQGERLCQPVVEDLAKLPRLVLLCGRYEGFDQRVIDILQPREISVGDYILNGGEVAAMVLVDSVIRLIPGVLGDERSHQQDSFSSDGRWLEFAQYTRPRQYRGHEVPDVLLSGNHEQIEQWRREQSYRRTANRRADLLTGDQDEPSAQSD